MAYSSRMQRSHLYSIFFAPRGGARMADLGMQMAQQYLSPYDKLIGLVGAAGSGKSMLIKGMFPGLELTNDDDGVNIRPLPLLNVEEHGFYTAHTYHLDIKFESAFTQMHVLADAILNAISLGKRIIVEHFELIYPYIKRNAHLLIGVGEEVLITRPTLFGPEPEEVAEVVFKSINHRRMAHSAEDLCEYVMKKHNIKNRYTHSDVKKGFILSFEEKPDIDLKHFENEVKKLIDKDLPISYHDDDHILIGDELHRCTGPRMHMKSTGEIKNFRMHDEFLIEPITELYLMVGLIGSSAQQKISELNKIIF